MRLVPGGRLLRNDAHGQGSKTIAYFFNKLNHRSTNTGLGSTTSAPRGGDITDKNREVRAGRRQGSRPSGHARTKEEAR